MKKEPVKKCSIKRIELATGEVHLLSPRKVRWLTPESKKHRFGAWPAHEANLIGTGIAVRNLVIKRYRFEVIPDANQQTNTGEGFK